MENEIFTVRCYSKSELAMMYFPELSQEMASQKLKRWIRRCTPLMGELAECGFSTSSCRKDLTPREVRLIVRHLGEPIYPEEV